MRKVLSLLLGLAIIAGIASATPTIYGSSGLIRVISASNSGPMSFGLGFHGVGYMKDTASLNTKNVEAYPAGYFSFNEMIEISVAPKYNWYRTKNATAYVADKIFMSNNGLFDTRFGVKGSFKMNEMFVLGAYLGYDIPTQGMMDTCINAKNYLWWGYGHKHLGIIQFKAMPGFSFAENKAKLDINLGVGYKMDKDTIYTATGKSFGATYPNIGFPFGIGFSYQVNEWLQPFLEISGKAGIDSTKYYAVNAGTFVKDYKRGVLNNPTFITPGLRFTLPYGFKVDLAFDYNIQKKDTIIPMGLVNGMVSAMTGTVVTDINSLSIPAAQKAALSNGLNQAIRYHPDLNKQCDWQVIFGLAYAPTKPSGPKVPPTATIAGKVTGKDGKPVPASITVGGITVNNDPATGAYSLAGVNIPEPPAPVEVRIQSKGFLPQTQTVMLDKKLNFKKKIPATKDVVLEPVPIPKSDFSVVVIDYKSGAAITGTATIKGPKPVTIKTSEKTQLEPGNYQVTVSVDGYTDKTVAVTIGKEGKPVSQNVALVKKKEVFSFGKVYFLTGKAAIKPESEATLEQIHKILADNPEIKVEIGGHTDAVGNKKKNEKLSLDRASSVVTWLTAKGISSSRLFAKGYGSMFPIASNKTKAGREQNRRIEVKVID